LFFWVIRLVVSSVRACCRSYSSCFYFRMLDRRVLFHRRFRKKKNSEIFLTSVDLGRGSTLHSLSLPTTPSRSRMSFLRVASSDPDTEKASPRLPSSTTTDDSILQKGIKVWKGLPLVGKAGSVIVTLLIVWNVLLKGSAVEIKVGQDYGVPMMRFSESFRVEPEKEVPGPKSVRTLSLDQHERLAERCRMFAAVDRSSSCEILP